MPKYVFDDASQPVEKLGPETHDARSVPTFEMGVLEVSDMDKAQPEPFQDYQTHFPMGDVTYGLRFPHPTEVIPEPNDMDWDEVGNSQPPKTTLSEDSACLLGPSPDDHEAAVRSSTNEDLYDPSTPRNLNPRPSSTESKPLPYTQSPCPYYPNEEKLMLEYIFLVVPRHPCFSNTYRAIWISLMEYAQWEETQMARNAFLCMAATRMGRWVGHPELYEWGTKIYAATLSQLLQALKEGTLAIAMGLRESMPIIENGWESQRFQVTTTHLVPFLPHGIASIPAKLQRADHLGSMFRTGACVCDQFLDLISDCTTLSESLEIWYQETEHAAGDKTLYELQPSTIDRENARNSSTPFPEQYRFQNPAVSVHLVLYWSAQLLLRATVNGLEKNAQRCQANSHYHTNRSISSATASFKAFLPSHKHHALALATHIARSAEYMTHDDIRFIGPYLFIHPLHLAAQVYDAVTVSGEEDPNRDKRDWCHSMIACINLRGHPFETPYKKAEVKWCPENPRRLPIRFQTSFPPLKGFGRLAVGAM
ncbi:MAG: hypothetical protein Q9227_006451 [Pyrenula ochraceoflavens]